MGIADQLDLLRSEFPDCASITFTDLASGLVLCASTRKKVPQERLDALCNQARELFGGSTASDAMGLGSAEGVTGVVLHRGDRIVVFLRSPVEQDEALCCECEPGTDLAAFLDRARSELVAIGATY